MRVLIYKNISLKENSSLTEYLINDLIKNNIEYLVIDENDLKNKYNADFLFVFGGDGTILKVVDFAIINDLSIVGINTGNLGFLTEFEKTEYSSAVQMILDSNYKIDSRSVLDVEINKKHYFALNDAVIQRKYLDDYQNLVVKIGAFIDDNFVDYIKGDGVIVSTPTGSTAYSLSSGGSILAPNINANILTPICAHSLHSRPIVFSSNSLCRLNVVDGSVSSLFIDGKFVDNLKIGDEIIISNSNKKIKFIRRQDSNFYKILLTKLAKGN